MKKHWALALSMVFCVSGAVFFFKGWNKSASLTTGPAAPTGEMRQPSSYNPDRNDNGADVEELNNILYDITTKKDVDPAFAKIHEVYKKYPQSPAAHLYSSLARTAASFKGIAWRARFLVEPIDAAYLSVISTLRAIKRNNDRRAPHLDALFDYFVDPNPGENIYGQTGQFSSLAQFQDWMASQVAPRIEGYIATSKQLTAKADPDVPLFYFDAGLIFGPAAAQNMGSQTVRFRKFLPGHLRGMIANMEERMGFGYYLASYNMEDLGKFINTLTARSLVAKKSDFGTGAISNVFDIHLQSPKEISQVLPKFPRFLTLRPQGQKYLPKAYQMLVAANNDRIEAYKAMQRIADLPNQNEYFLNADALTSRNNLDLPVLQKRKRILSGEVIFNDRVTNEEFSINVPALFNIQNKSIHDLKKFYPNQFEAVSEKNGSDPKTFRWNYQYGMATNWPDPSFGGLLPGTHSAQDYKNKLISISRDASTPALTYFLRLFY